MALKKAIMADNGVVTEYHRIALITVDVNQQNTYLIHSYLGEDGRQIEKDYAAGLYSDQDPETIHFPYVIATYIHADYNPETTVSNAYAFLKTLPLFEGAEDI